MSPVCTALLRISSATCRTTSVWCGVFVKIDRQTCHPDGSVRSWLRYSKACPLMAWSEEGFQAISMAFATYMEVPVSFDVVSRCGLPGRIDGSAGLSVGCTKGIDKKR